MGVSTWKGKAFTQSSRRAQLWRITLACERVKGFSVIECTQPRVFFVFCLFLQKRLYFISLLLIGNSVAWSRPAMPFLVHFYGFPKIQFDSEHKQTEGVRWVFINGWNHLCVRPIKIFLDMNLKKTQIIFFIEKFKFWLIANLFVLP